MKRICHILLLLIIAVTTWAQGCNALEQVKNEPRKAYGTDYPYPYENVALTKAPSGYKPFYISQSLSTLVTMVDTAHATSGTTYCTVKLIQCSLRLTISVC